MENTIATASVDVFQIKRRKYSHRAFRTMQRLFYWRSSDSIDSILIHPPVEDLFSLGDICNRLGWYLPNQGVNDCVVHIPISDQLDIDDATPPEASGDFTTNLPPISTHDPSDSTQLVGQVDCILVWDASRRFDRITVKNIGNVEIIDPTYYSTIECSTWPRISDRVLSPPKQNYSKKNFEELQTKAKEADAAYVFATGPSLDSATEFDFPENAIKIVCNSMVNNQRLLNHINPDIAVFADPVFHFGPSRYADKFRQDLSNTLSNYDCVAIFLDRYYNLLSNHYPDLHDQFITLNAASSDTPIFPDENNLNVMGTSNIMTLFMLPLAMSLSNKIYIIGADGRKESESYFWEHSDNAQYDDELMSSVAETHPSFFRDRVYEDYYKQHVQTLTDMIKYGESHEIETYNLTHSYVPCLRERSLTPEEAGVL